MSQPSRGEQIDPHDFCIEMPGRNTDKGYAWLRSPTGRPGHAHRVVMGFPIGMVVHHLCGNPPCIRIDHLKLLTPSKHSKIHRRRPAVNCIKCGGAEFRYKIVRTGKWKGNNARCCVYCAKLIARRRYERKMAKLGKEVRPYCPKDEEIIEFRGESLSLRAWALRLDVVPGALRRRLEKWSKEAALTSKRYAHYPQR